MKARALASRVLSVGVISPGLYSVLTGLAMLTVAFLLGSAADTDPAAPVVGLGLGILGVALVERGVRQELRRRRTP